MTQLASPALTTAERLVLLPPRTYRRRLAAAGVVGGLLGVVTSISNQGYGVAPAHASQLLDAPWTWVAVGMVPAFAARRWVQSALLSALTFWAAICCYHVTELRFGVYSSLAPSGDPTSESTDWLNFASDMVGYGIVAVFAAAGLAAIIVIIRRGGVLGFLVKLIVPAYALHGSYTRVRDAYIVTDSTATLVAVKHAVSAVSALVLVALLVAGLIGFVSRHRHNASSSTAETATRHIA